MDSLHGRIERQRGQLLRRGSAAQWLFGMPVVLVVATAVSGCGGGGDRRFHIGLAFVDGSNVNHHCHSCCRRRIGPRRAPAASSLLTIPRDHKGERCLEGCTQIVVASYSPARQRR
jgi:hypothetical protein